ncbi:MAG: type IV pilus assembly protein FimV, partial [Burkholderiales bacterium]
MSNSVSAIRLAAAALLCVPLLAHAAGLGRLTVHSALGQPLNAEIEIVSLQAGEGDSLTARLASPEAFRQAGMEMSSALVSVQFSIERRAGGHVIRMRTAQPVNEPFLDLLVELQWTSGRLVREYTFLLDPPEYKGPQPIAAAPAPEARPLPAPAAPDARVEARPISPAPAAPVGTHEVKRGDTLGAIARKNKPEGVTLNQMMIALFRANQAAFIRGNINLVRAGRILNIPDREAVAAVETADANGLVKTHMADFAEYKRRLAETVAAAPAAPAPREREVTGRIAPKPAVPAPAEPKDQLKLSKADPAKPGAPAARAAREDDRVARDRALKDAQSRVGDLEKNVSDLQKLVEMKNQQLAELEKKAGAKPAPAAPVAKAPEPAKPAAAAKAPEATKAPEAAKAPVEKPNPEKPAAEAAKPAAPEAAKPAPEKPAAEAPKPATGAPQPAAAEKPPAAPKPAAEAPKAKPEP